MTKSRNYLAWLGPAIIRHEDGATLREIGNIWGNNTDELVTDESRWEIKLYTKTDVVIVDGSQGGTITPSDFLWEIGQEDELFFDDEISHRLEWEYSHLESSKLPVKVSVTELKRYLDTEFSEETTSASIEMPVLVKRPAFLEEAAKGMTSAEWGSLVHFVLQHLDFQKTLSKGDIEGQIHEMARIQLITQEQADAVDVLRIERFLRSPLGARLLAAPRLFREVPFTIELPSTKLYPELSHSICGDDGIILQGIIDCYFEEPEGIVLLDYKTDYVAPSHGIDLIRDRYRAQIEYYTYALEKITGKRVIGKYIYLFWNGQVLEY